MTFEKSSSKLHQLLDLEWLEDRFTKLTDNFIKKSNQNDFCGWYNQRIQLHYISSLRNPRILQETQSVFSNLFNSPISYYIRRSNNLLNLEQTNPTNAPVDDMPKQDHFNLIDQPISGPLISAIDAESASTGNDADRGRREFDTDR